MPAFDLDPPTPTLLTSTADGLLLTSAQLTEISLWSGLTLYP